MHICMINLSEGIKKTMKINKDLSSFGCQIRPYSDAQSVLSDIGYAVVIPFKNKKDCLQFCEETNLDIDDIIDNIPANLPLGLYNKTIKYMYKIGMTEEDIKKTVEEINEKDNKQNVIDV